jgi:hypothetical protein
MNNYEHLINKYIEEGSVMAYYYEVWGLWQNNSISEDLWNKFCFACLDTLQEDNYKIYRIIS